MTTLLPYSPVFLEHEAPGHPERPDRLRAIVEHMQASGLWQQAAVREPEPIAEPDLRLVHDAGLLEHVRSAGSHGLSWLDSDTYVGPKSIAAALLAAGATVGAALEVMQARAANALVLCRPPGHHATKSRAMGFCLFNNVSAAAAKVLAEGLAGRVFIADLDVHHGNGTQDIFYDRADVYYFSVHQYPFYPGTGRLEEIGMATGLGFTANVPLPAGCGDSTYARVADELLLPLARRYEPDLILVSLGFDAFWQDPLAQMRLSVAGYLALVERTLEAAGALSGGRVVIVLEGGYHLGALANGTAGVLQLLLGEPVTQERLEPPASDEPAGGAAVIARAREIHRLP